MGHHDFLWIIAIILLSTKFIGLVSEKVHMPQVVGALVAGIILGPSVLGIISENEFISNTSSIGVILLMFLAGLDTNLEDLKETGFASSMIAIAGVILPLVGGFLAHYLYFGYFGGADLMESIFVGIVLTATSVSITVETLRELGRLKGRLGTIILGAAIIDDIIGIVVLTIAMSMKDPTLSIEGVLVKTIAFFLLLILLFISFKYIARRVEDFDNHRRVAIYGFAFCLIMAYLAEVVFGVADITGAYAAGIILCNSGIKHYIAKKINIISYMFFSPIFFANVGISTSLDGLTPVLIGFSVLLIIVALITKIAGGYIASRFVKLNHKESIVVGCGMVARSEVALIMAQKGAAAGLLSATLFPPVILMVVVTTLVTPILLKITVGRLSDNSPHNPHNHAA